MTGVAISSIEKLPDGSTILISRFGNVVVQISGPHGDVAEYFDRIAERLPAVISNRPHPGLIEG